MSQPRPIDLLSLSAWLRYAKITCTESVKACADAIAADPAAAKIFTHISSDAALAEAQKLDSSQALRSAIKPLAGIVFTAQETITIDGQPTSAATKLDVPDLMPPQGGLVKKLRDLGAVPIGKTAGTEFSFPLHQLTHSLQENPCYSAVPHTAGGSAAAVGIAKGLASFALASDAAGTARVSAALCGVTGFRGGSDFWPRDGAFPLSRELDSIGLITASAADLAFMLEAFGAGASPNMPLPKLRLGIAQKTFYDGLDPAVTQAITAALETLNKNGAVLTGITIPDYEALKSFNRIANGAGLVRYIGRDRMQAGFGQMDPVTQILLQPGMAMEVSEIQHLFEARRLLANRVNSNLAHIDALIMPTLTGLAVPTASLTDADAVVAWQLGLTRNIDFVGLFNMAAVTIPIPGPLPIGLQLTGPGGTEVKLAAIARTIQQTLQAASK